MRLTATEQRIYDRLSDGRMHHADDLLKLFDDDLAEKQTLIMHISNLRKKIAAQGRDIVCQVSGRNYYRMVRVL